MRKKITPPPLENKKEKKEALFQGQQIIVLNPAAPFCSHLQWGDITDHPISC